MTKKFEWPQQHVDVAESHGAEQFEFVLTGHILPGTLEKKADGEVYGNMAIQLSLQNASSEQLLNLADILEDHIAVIRERARKGSN